MTSLRLLLSNPMTGTEDARAPIGRIGTIGSVVERGSADRRAISVPGRCVPVTTLLSEINAQPTSTRREDR